MSGVVNLSSGKYDQRLGERQTTLEDEQDRSVALQRDNDRLSQQQQATKMQLSRLEGEYIQLSNEVAELEHKLASVKGDTSELERRLRELQQQISMVQNDQFAGESARQKTLEDLRRRLGLVRSELEVLLGG